MFLVNNRTYPLVEKVFPRAVAHLKWKKIKFKIFENFHDGNKKELLDQKINHKYKTISFLAL